MSLAVSNEDKNECIIGKIGNQIRRYRNSRGLSQGQLGEKVKVSMTTISRLENGRQMVSVAKLVEISEALQIEAGILLCDFDFTQLAKVEDVDSQIASMLRRCSVKEKRFFAEILENYIKYRQGK